MSVFDGGAHRVTVLMRSGDETEHYPNDVREFVASLRTRPDVRAFETRWIHFVEGEAVDDLSDGDIYADEDEEDE
ncbi:hypothetical protein [Streptomyces sp. NPDC002952]|uniref:hypothetical protein n=1 Tax=Streptomyces sp. NPDC002952 TaxID=3364673 RepID=UPI0036918F96